MPMESFDITVLGEDISLVSERLNYATLDNGECYGIQSFFDKDSEELYEGDIIRSFDSEGNSILHHIEYRGASFVAILKDSFPLYGNIITQDWLKEFKKTIIGNIHNNKEYLEE